MRSENDIIQLLNSDTKPSDLFKFRLTIY